MLLYLSWLFCSFPLIQVCLNSFRDDLEVKLMPIGLPQEWVFYNYSETWLTGEYGIAFLNSLKIAFL